MPTCTCVDSRTGGVAKGHGQPLIIPTHTLSTDTGPPVVTHSISSLRLAGQKQAHWPVLHRRVASILVTTRCSNRSHLPHRSPTPPRNLASRDLYKVCRSFVARFIACTVAALHQHLPTNKTSAPPLLPTQLHADPICMKLYSHSHPFERFRLHTLLGVVLPL